MLNILKKLATSTNANYSDYWFNPNQVYKNHVLGLNDLFYNKIHLGTYSGLIKKINCLSYSDNSFDFFYEWYPLLSNQKNKFLGIFSSNDLVNFNHQKNIVYFNKKNNYDGIFLGNLTKINNELNFFWISDQIKSKKKLNKIVVKTKLENNKLNTKETLFEIDNKLYLKIISGPKLFKFNNKNYLFLSVQKTNQECVIIVYKTIALIDQYEFLGEINFENAPFNNKNIIFEAFDFFNQDETDVFVLSLNQNDLTNQIKNLFVLGKMNWKNLNFWILKVQQIDFGYDFYAPQILNQPNKPTLIAWAVTASSQSIPTWKNLWLNSLIYPRVLSIKNNHVYQLPHSSLKKLQNKKLKKLEAQTFFKFRQKEIFLTAKKSTFNFQLTSSHEPNKRIFFKYANGIFTIDNTLMHAKLKDYQGKIWDHPVAFIENILIILDNSLIEIFINNGREVFTIKYFLLGRLIWCSENLLGHYCDLNPLEINWKDQKIIIVPGNAFMNVFKSNNKYQTKIQSAAMNVAVALKKWNHIPYFIGAVGNDYYGRKIITKFEEINLATNYLQIHQCFTTTANTQISYSKQYKFSFKSNSDQMLEIYNIPNQYDVLVLSSATAFLGGNLLKLYEATLKNAIKNNKLICFDPNFQINLYYDKILVWIGLAKQFIEKANVIKLTSCELNLIFFKSSFDEQTKFLSQQYPNKLFVIFSEPSEILLIKNNNIKKINSIPTHLINNVGYNAFFGSFIAQLISFLDHISFAELTCDLLNDAIFWSNIITALTIENCGESESIPNLETVQSYYNKHLLKHQKSI